MVSPRKSRRKSACFSRTRTATPTRASNSPQHHASRPATGDAATDRNLAGGHRLYSCASVLLAGYIMPEGAFQSRASFASHWRQRRQTGDLLQRFRFFHSRGFSCRNIVTVGGAVRFRGRRLCRDNADRRTAGDALGTEKGRNRSFVIGLGHGELSV